jgi:hypothetical protein
MCAMLRTTPPRGLPCPRPAQQIIKSASGRGRCSVLASSHGARIQTSRASSVVSITGIALSWADSNRVGLRYHKAIDRDGRCRRAAAAHEFDEVLEPA